MIRRRGNLTMYKVSPHLPRSRFCPGPFVELFTGYGTLPWDVPLPAKPATMSVLAALRDLSWEQGMFIVSCTGHL